MPLSPTAVATVTALCVLGAIVLALVLFQQSREPRAPRACMSHAADLFDAWQDAELPHTASGHGPPSHAQLFVSSPQARTGSAYEAAQQRAARARAQREADVEAIRNLRVPVWQRIFYGVPIPPGVHAALQNLTSRQFHMLRRWIIRHAPQDAIGTPRYGRQRARSASSWVEVGSLRSEPESGALADVRVAPLYAQQHQDEVRRYNYRMRFRDANGGEAWVQLGDEDARRDGMRWVRHGDKLTVLGHTWTAFLEPHLQNRWS